MRDVAQDLLDAGIQKGAGAELGAHHLDFGGGEQVVGRKVKALVLRGPEDVGGGQGDLNEVVDGCIAYIDDREITIEELIKHVKAPDFPTGGIIYGYDGVKTALMTGRGRVVLRGKTTVETDAKGKEKIIITDIPYQVNRDTLTQKIGELINEKVIEGISDVNNESNNKEGTRWGKTQPARIRLKYLRINFLILL
jgi:hypothetical protein